MGAALAALQATRQALIGRALRDVAAVACRTLVQRVDAWQGRPRPAGELPGVVFGDSVFLATDHAKAFTPTVAQSLAAPGRAVALLDLTHLGISAFQFYYLADRVVAGGPRFAVVEVNLRTFATDWQQTAWLRFPQLAGGLSLRQAWAMRDELASQSLSPLAPLAYRLQETTGTLFMFDGLRRLGTDALEKAGADLNEALGLTTRSLVEKRQRILRQNLVLDAERARAWYGRDFVGTPHAAVLRVLARDLRAAGVKTFFVVAPVNRYRLAQFGLSLADLTSRTEALRRAIGGRRAAWIDLSGVFGPRDFVDALHLKPDSVQRLATFVGQQVRQQLQLQ